MGPMLRWRADWLALFFCLAFIGLASAWISEIGVQSDEALFSAGIYPPLGPGVELLGKHRTLMLMSYVGAVKSYVWKPIVRNVGASAVATRLPAVLLGAITLWLFYVLMQRTLDARVALIGRPYSPPTLPLSSQRAGTGVRSPFSTCAWWGACFRSCASARTVS